MGARCPGNKNTNRRTVSGFSFGHKECDFKIVLFITYRDRRDSIICHRCRQSFINVKLVSSRQIAGDHTKDALELNL